MELIIVRYSNVNLDLVEEFHEFVQREMCQMREASFKRFATNMARSENTRSTSRRMQDLLGIKQLNSNRYNVLFKIFFCLKIL